MKVTCERQGSVQVVIPQDAINEPALDALQRALAPDGGGANTRLVLDMTHVPFVDSAGLEYLLAVAGNVSNGALRPRLAGLTDAVREAMYLTDTLKRFQVFESVEAAVRSYR